MENMGEERWEVNDAKIYDLFPIQRICEIGMHGVAVTYGLRVK